MTNSTLVSFLILAYNQKDFIDAAIQSALDQTYSPLEVIISDDCSNDGTYDAICRKISEYDGKHSIIVIKTPRNSGICANINWAMQHVKGQLVVVAAGDDISLPNRVAEIYNVYQASDGKAMSIYSNAIVIDSSGNHEGLHLIPPEPEMLSVEWMAKHGTGVLGCTHAWDRRVFDLFGPLREDVIREDIVIPFRSALLGEVKFINSPLVLYRRHANNIHFKLARHVNIDEIYFLLSRHARGNIAIYENRISDLKKIASSYPGNQEDILNFKKSSLYLLREMEIEHLILSEIRWKRLLIILKLFFQRYNFRKVVKWSLIGLFPRIYIFYQRFISLRVNIKKLNIKYP